MTHRPLRASRRLRSEVGLEVRAGDERREVLQLSRRWRGNRVDRLSASGPGAPRSTRRGFARHCTLSQGRSVVRCDGRHFLPQTTRVGSEGWHSPHSAKTAVKTLLANAGWLRGSTPSARRVRSDRRASVSGVRSVEQMRQPASPEARSIGKRDFTIHNGDRVIDQQRVQRREVCSDGFLKRDS